MLESKMEQAQETEPGPAKLEGDSGSAGGDAGLDGAAFSQSQREIGEGALENGEAAGLKEQEVGSEGLLPESGQEAALEAPGEGNDFLKEDDAGAGADAGAELGSEGLLPQEAANEGGDENDLADASFPDGSREIANDALESGEVDDLKDRFEAQQAEKARDVEG